MPGPKWAVPGSLRSAPRATRDSCPRAPAIPRRPASERLCARRCIAIVESCSSWQRPLSKSIFTLGVVIQGSPEQPVDDHDEQAHGAYPEHDAVKVPGGGRLRDIG